MRRIVTVVGILVLVLATALPATAITWGEPDTEHTNVGAIVVEFPGYGLYQLCSGTLIHPRVFLTAGHCTSRLDPGLGGVWVNFDEDALNAGTLVEVEQAITHPDYDSRKVSNPHDVGVLILSEPVTDIEPAVLPPEGFLEQLRKDPGLRGETFTVVGYGGTLDFPPPELSYDNMRQSAESGYLALLKAWLLMTQNQARCYGGTCYGDSGGPAFWTEADGSEILVGITAWGDARCVATGFDYRVDIPETLSFIQDVIEGLE